MNQQLLEVKRERFHLLDPNIYILQGTFPKEYELAAYLDSVRIQASVEDWETTSALERFKEWELLNGRKVTVRVTLPDNLGDFSKLTIMAVLEDEKIPWFQIRVKDLLARQGRPQYYIEEERVDNREGTCQIRGWAVAAKRVAVKVFDQERQPVACQIQMTNRVDVAEMYKECQVEEKCGFFIQLEQVKSKKLYLVFWTPESKAVHTVSLQSAVILKNKVEKYRKKGMSYLRTHGVKALAQKAFRKVATVKQRPVDYQKWLPKHLPGSAELQRQRKTEFALQPKISLVVPLYKTNQEYLRQLIASVQSQTYGNWELCLSDGSGAESPLREALEQYRQGDGRIRVISSPEPLQISQNTNRAILEATGDFIAFADHDDVLTENALFECVKAFNENPALEVFYSDEDKMTMDGNKFFQPHFKPDFNLDLLCSVNYICHLFVVSRQLVEKVGILRPEYDGAQDYDFIFRCVEATDQICHIPKILYHWRSHEQSTSENPESKRYAFEAGQRAVQAHYDRIGVNAQVLQGEYLGLYRTRFLRERDPLISIIIPNKDHIDDLKRCMDSIEAKSTYRNYEYVIVENNSTREETFAYYKELEETNPKAHVFYWDGPFNYSAINNFGAERAKGEYLLLLNNDTEIINPDCLEELLGYCMRADVGIVGARLYYEDDTIQHAGVVLGFGGIAGHCFVQQPRSSTGYCHRIICAQDYSAVTAACLMVSKALFDQVGGLSEDLQVAFNDIDFCLKVRDQGKLVVYNPYAQLYHYESKSRGLEDTPEKIARFNKEIATLEQHWPDIFRRPDPYYNPNLTLDSQDFSLKRI